ncbi:survival motor neuron protein [Rhagoletis pomonella]|uniref:survival motor neuron protein n=1 Tax=Rhagoletis pomonella TaxID=28610 RepID=UPI00177AFA04|nr:survival motor neuron protein [Rhagoletis pomonella]
MESCFKSFEESRPIEVWDDTMLVKSYNDGVNLLNEDVAKRVARNTNVEPAKASVEGTMGVKEGDYVRATYEIDGCDYEAKIITVDETNATCLVRYIGYDNEQTVNLKDLVPSWGKNARRVQIERAKNSTNKYGNVKRQSLKLRESYLSKVPPPPPMPLMLTKNIEGSEHLSAMLMSWYMSGYYTGIYEGLHQKN